MSNIKETDMLRYDTNHSDRNTVTIDFYTTSILCPHCKENINISNQSKPAGRPRKDLTVEQIQDRIEKQRKTALNYYYKKKNKNNIEQLKEPQEII